MQLRSRRFLIHPPFWRYEEVHLNCLFYVSFSARNHALAELASALDQKNSTTISLLGLALSLATDFLPLHTKRINNFSSDIRCMWSMYALCPSP